MNDFLSNINSSTFTFSAIAIGYILTEELSPAEENSIGNWFMLIGQVLCTDAAQQQVINNKENNNSSPNIVNDKYMGTLKKTVNQMNNELNKF